jgi:hypothetical protein
MDRTPAPDDAAPAIAMADKKAFLLRIDPMIWVGLERLAQSELRSVNAQIEFLLRDALARRGIEAKPPRTTRSAADRKPAS